MSESPLPNGYKEAKKLATTIELSGEQLPWMSSGKIMEVELTEVVLNSGKKFLLGSAVAANETLKNEASKFTKEQQVKVNNQFYEEVMAYIERRGGVPKLQHPKGGKLDIWYAQAGSSGRMYFVQVGSRDGLPIIIKIAACTKPREEKVLSVISSRRK